MYFEQLKTSVLTLIVLSVLTGLVYPLAMTGLAQILFSRQANGSLILTDSKPVGSSLIGQPFDDPKYFWSRLSATSPAAYNGSGSSGSNLGPLNPALFSAVQARVEALKVADPENKNPIPVDLVTSSASGLDPHISPAAARYQLNRVAQVRKIPLPILEQLIRRHTTGRLFGILGESCVNVLELNLDLDSIKI